MGAEVHFKALALIRGSKWESLDLAGREEMASAALSELRHLGPEVHGFGFGQGGRVGVVGFIGTKRDGVSGHGEARFACFKGTLLRFVESIGTKRVEERGPE